MIVLIQCLVCAANSQGLIHSEAVSGIFAEITFPSGRELKSNAMIRYCFLTTNTLGSRLFYPTQEYFCRAKLWDERGRPVQPRGVGTRLGRHFSDLKVFSESKVRHINRGGSDTPRPFVDNLRPDACGAKNLYSPEELFDLEKPGRYRLQLEFQVFLQCLSGTNVSYKLIRLPPIEMHVVKAERDVSKDADNP